MPADRLLVTGATGLTGQYVLNEMLERFPERRFICTVREGSKSSRVIHERVEYVHCDVAIPEQVCAVMRDHAPFDEALHIVQLRHTPIVIDALLERGMNPRLVVVGTTGVFSKYQAYSEEYQRAEEALRTRYPNHVLLRPTLIYGSRRDKNLHMLIRFIDKRGFFPVFGSGAGKFQPIHYKDLGDAILAVMERPELTNKQYNLSGATVIEYRNLLRLVAELLDRPFRRLLIPTSAGRVLGRIADGMSRRREKKLPFSEEQVLRLLEDKVFDHSEAARDLGFKPRDLRSGLAEEIDEMLRHGDLPGAAERKGKAGSLNPTG